ncbi:hypothetical protein EYF80_028914 [Liparis tanakae]|uniref:Uncharacterized protein n=1 Tax=Liparis tanakae TaxID=230148 RepID=A0A4Z2H569_9TELE|nr:hypothetical protein EYF80_028914 [Liparis tanakae]
METSTIHQMEAERRSGRSPNSGQSPNRAAAQLVAGTQDPDLDAPSADRIYAVSASRSGDYGAAVTPIVKSKWKKPENNGFGKRNRATVFEAL